MANYITRVGCQQVQPNQNAGTSTSTNTITATGSLADCFWGGFITDSTATSAAPILATRLTASTTLTSTRNSSSVISTDGISVIDGTSNLYKSIQYVTASWVAGLGVFPIINAVNLSYATVHILGINSAGTTSSTIFPYASFTDSTHLAVIVQASTTATVYLVVKEYEPTCMAQAVQAVTPTWTTGTTKTATITSVNTNNALTINAGFTANQAGINSAQCLQYGQLTNSTTYTVTVNTSGTASKENNAFIVEFNSGVLAQSVQRGTAIILSASTGGGVTISSAPLSQSIFSHLGNIVDSTAGNQDRTRIYGYLSNSTTVQYLSYSTLNNKTASYEVATWPAYVDQDALWFGMTF